MQKSIRYIFLFVLFFSMGIGLLFSAQQTGGGQNKVRCYNYEFTKPFWYVGTLEDYRKEIAINEYYGKCVSNQKNCGERYENPANTKYQDFGQLRKCDGSKIIKYTEKSDSFDNSCLTGRYTQKQDKEGVSKETFVCEAYESRMIDRESEKEKDGDTSDYGTVLKDWELEGKVQFFKLVDGEVGAEINTEKSEDGKFIQENFWNKFVNTDIRVIFTCTSNDCKEPKSSQLDFDKNGTGKLFIESNNGKKIEANINIRKISKEPPTLTLTYIPNLGSNEWTNGSVVVELMGIPVNPLNWIMNDIGKEVFTCDVHGGCEGTLSIEDSAGNVASTGFLVKNIDKHLPNIHLNLENQFSGGKQKIGITCTDEGEGQSGCEFEGEQISWQPMGTSQWACVRDKAGNEQCISYSTARSDKDYSDEDFPWVNRDRRLWLTCNDNFGPIRSGCPAPLTKTRIVGGTTLYIDQKMIGGVVTSEKYINKNTLDVPLTVTDAAGNTITKHFQISKVDQTPPTATFSGKFEFKASEGDKIKISFADKPDTGTPPGISGVDGAVYTWDKSCKSGNSMTGTGIANNSWINYTVAGTHTLYVCVKDKAGNIGEIKKSGIIIHPGDLAGNNLQLKVDSNGDKYANGKDKYTYTLVLRDKYNNPIHNKNLKFVSHDIYQMTGLKTIYTDTINNTGAIALETTIPNMVSNGSGEIQFYLTSIAPGEFTQFFKIIMYKWGDDYKDDLNTEQTSYSERLMPNNSFKNPISIDKIQASNDGKLCQAGVNRNAIPDLGKEQSFKIGLKNDGGLPTNGGNLSINGGKLDINSQTVIDSTEGHKWVNSEIGQIKNTFGNDFGACLGFTGTLDAYENKLVQPVLKNNDLKISYNIEKDGVSYLIVFYLEESKLEGCEKGTLGVKVQGTLQSDGKANTTGQESNFSDLSTSEMRTIIKRNASELIRGMNGLIDSTPINGVKYVDLTNATNKYYKISQVPANTETLIIKNGNLFVDVNISTTSGKPFGVIILKDNYDVNKDWNIAGNVYVASNVKTMNAIIYADGTLRSANEIGKSYEDSQLLEQLTINGSLFTRNTIGGATLSTAIGGDYLLPGGKKITDFNQAQIYDLNYIRKTPICGPDDYALLIKYDARIQTNPPKGFTK